MMGTLATLLAKKGIRSHKEVYHAQVIGDIEDINGVLKISRIHVNYYLKVTEDKQQDAREALDAYLSFCPAAQSVIGCIELQHQLRFLET
jgi:organic hydroperoxide reductase OsmC/OhrA